jgi:hypothetical protein
MSDVNKHGCPRTIRADVKRAVRRRAGFGCIVCGKAFGQYHHFDPKFEDARSHDPARIVYLCPNHHEDADDGRLSEASLRHFANDPRALQLGFTFGAFDMRCEKPILHVGTVTGVNCRNFFRIDGRPILWINPPETIGGPFLLNADLVDSKGTSILRIVDNDWEAYGGKFDVVTVGRRISIYEKKRGIDLVIRTEPPADFHIDRLDMDINGYRIVCDGQQVTALPPSKRGSYSFADSTMEEALSVIDMDGDIVGYGVVR